MKCVMVDALVSQKDQIRFRCSRRSYRPASKIHSIQRSESCRALAVSLANRWPDDYEAWLKAWFASHPSRLEVVRLSDDTLPLAGGSGEKPGEGISQKPSPLSEPKARLSLSESKMPCGKENGCFIRAKKLGSGGRGWTERRKPRGFARTSLQPRPPQFRRFGQHSWRVPPPLPPEARYPPR